MKSSRQDLFSIANIMAEKTSGQKDQVTQGKPIFKKQPIIGEVKYLQF